MYCIYTDKDVPEDKGNLDHIIPLSLGGLDEFVTWSEEAINSIMGSKIDGALHKDSFIQFALKETGVTGHSKTPVERRWRKVTMDGKPIQITWGKEKVTFWDSRERREIGEQEVAGKELQVELKVDAYLAFKFIAKVSL